jgi:hypothetical protein
MMTNAEVPDPIMGSGSRIRILVAIIGGLIAGAYGIVHDQVTYTIAPEYFTKLKFHQFHYADFGLGNRIFAATIGFLATWWVGAIAAWLLARRLNPDRFHSAVSDTFSGCGAARMLITPIGTGRFNASTLPIHGRSFALPISITLATLAV